MHATQGMMSIERLERRHAVRARELTLHLSLLAAAVWLFVAADLLSPGPLGRHSGVHKGNDFVQFYVMGSLSKAGLFRELVDPVQFRRAQSGYKIAGHQASYPPVYGPHVALAFVPFAFLPYLGAYAAWLTITISLVAWAVRVCWDYTEPLHPWPWPVIAGTAAFPPMGYLVLNGQISAIGLAALALLVTGLMRRSSGCPQWWIAAGLAIGILGYKFSLLIPALVVCAVALEWIVATTGIAFVLLQFLAVLPIVGAETLFGFLENTLAVTSTPDVLLVRPYLTASWRTFWAAFLPGPLAWVAYGATAGATVLVAAWGWRKSADPVQRVGLLSIAIALTSPHFYLYDSIILVPAFIASAALLVRQRATGLRWCTYGAFLAPLAAPVAAFTKVQTVTLVFAAWLLALAWTIVRTRRECLFAGPTGDVRMCGARTEWLTTEGRLRAWKRPKT